MRLSTRSRLTLLAIAAVGLGVSLGFGSADGDQGPAFRSHAAVADIAPGQGSLAAVVRSETDRAGSVWARRNVVPQGSFLLASMVVSGLVLRGAGQGHGAVAAGLRRASTVPLRTAVGLRAPPRAFFSAPIA